MPHLVRAVEVAYDQMSAFYAYLLKRSEATLDEYHTLDARYCALVSAIRKCDVHDSNLLDGHLTCEMIARMQDVREVLDECQQQITQERTQEQDASCR